MNEHLGIIKEIAPRIKKLIDDQGKHTLNEVVEVITNAVENPVDKPGKFMKMIIESIWKERAVKFEFEKRIHELEDLCLLIKSSKFLTDGTHVLFNEACSNSRERNKTA